MAEGGGSTTWTVEDGIDLDGFLSQPLVVRVATVGRTGPSVRPLWYLWEGRCSIPSRPTERAAGDAATLGPDERHWRRFQGEVFDDPTMRFVALEPTVLRARDLSC
jgi:hypothetical protein